MKTNKYLSENGYLFVFLLGAALYFQQAWVPGFFADGYLYSAFAKHAANDGYWLVPRLSSTTYSEFPVHIPFIFSLNGIFFKLFGASYTTARLFSGLFTLISLFFVIRSVRKYGSESWAYLSGLAFVLIPPLIKKTRFPSLDAPLMMFVFISLLFYFEAFKKQNRKAWILCGVFFGFAMLSKGPMAGLVPLVILIHLAFTKSFSKLKDPFPWLGFTLGLIMFSIWPISLLLTGNKVTIDWYIKSTFINTMIEGRGVEKFNSFDYVIFLFKQTGPWLILILLSLKNYLKKKENDFHGFSLIAFFSLLILLSIPKFKYSNYLLPLYPFYAISVGFYLASLLKEGWFEKVKKGTCYLFVTASLVLLIFPLTVKTRRDKEIHQALKMSRGLKKQPEVWVTINDSYPFFALANLIAFENSGEVVNATLDWMKAYLNDEKKLEFKSEIPYEWEGKEFIFVMRNADFERIKSNYSEKLVSIIHFKARDLVILARKENVYPNGLTY